MAEPPLLYRALRAVVRTLMRVFFRDITVAGRRNVPEAGGGLLVAWHPNGVIDPALILSTFPGQIVFGARHGLLKWPLLGALMRGLGTVPIYRAQDAGTTDPEARRA
ncbi:MAG: 1-acyl-sn-glycerol-3-phosphate acyltransferase, partial [Bacteroidota bacterium]